MMAKTIFIVWANRSRRAETLTDELGGSVSFFHKADLHRQWLVPLGYLLYSWKTWQLLEQEQPEVVFVQSPPTLAPLVVGIWCTMKGKNRWTGQRRVYAIDCHPSTFYSPRWRWALPLLRFLAQRASVTICSNMEAENILQSWNVKGFFLADGIPILSSPIGTVGSQGKERVAFIGTFDSAEPISEFFEAAQLLPEVTFYVTGDPKLASNELLAKKPENVVLTGFLRGSSYTALLKNVHGLAILTNQPRDLSCAAYEAVAIAKPAIISARSENIRYFTRGFIYVENTPSAIADGVKKMLQNQELLIPEVIAMRSELAAKRQNMLEEVITLLKC